MGIRAFVHTKSREAGHNSRTHYPLQEHPALPAVFAGRRRPLRSLGRCSGARCLGHDGCKHSLHLRGCHPVEHLRDVQWERRCRQGSRGLCCSHRGGSGRRSGGMSGSGSGGTSGSWDRLAPAGSGGLLEECDSGANVRGCWIGPNGSGPYRDEEAVGPDGGGLGGCIELCRDGGPGCSELRRDEGPVDPRSCNEEAAGAEGCSEPWRDEAAGGCSEEAVGGCSEEAVGGHDEGTVGAGAGRDWAATRAGEGHDEEATGTGPYCLDREAPAGLGGAHSML
ncbi:hypothetical protein B0H14DRAFT_2567073 [Mycena olivaceomarginata]|nr:hypothetical protein B0H14DRAFT_2567073 [Mycena olivaceomarginata]